MEEKTPLISIDLGSNGGKIAFYSIEDIEKWLETEKNYWNWIIESVRFDGNTKQIWNQQSHPWRTLHDKINQIKNRPDEEIQGEITDIKTQIESSYKTIKTLHSSTPQAKLIEKHRDDTLTAAYLLNHFIKSPFTFNFSGTPQHAEKAITAKLQAMLFEKGLEDRVDSEMNALNELRQKYENLLTNCKRQVHDYDEIIRTYKNQMLENISTQKKSFEELMINAKSELTEITETYDKKLALQSSVSYWNNKLGIHLRLSRWFTGLFVLSLLVFGIFSVSMLQYLLGSQRVDQKPESWMVGMIIIVALIGIWAIRIIVRVMLSHYHLQRDAAERITMIQTYLALLREGNINEGDKQLILQTLFRPGVSGIIKDDAIPSSVWDFFTRAGVTK